MIVGLGIDLIELDRIERSLRNFGLHFIHKVLHDSERAFLDDGRDLLTSNTISRIAGRFAAKEAAVKALGTGFAHGIRLHDVRVSSLASGAPCLSFHGKARLRAETLGAQYTHLSVTHSRHSACAVVILESEGGRDPHTALL